MGDGQQEIELQGTLKGHTGWVTAIATTVDDSDTILTASRDKTIVVWKLTRDYVPDGDGIEVTGVMQRRLEGHNHFIEDIDISIDCQYALSASWDGTLRLWNLSNGVTTRRFQSHTKDVLSVSFSKDNRQIVSGSRDGSIKLWNTIGVCKKTLGLSDTGENEGTGHTDWVTCVRFSPNTEDPVIVSCGRDGLVKVWDLKTFSLKHNLTGHNAYVNTVTVSPDGSLCASGGKEGIAILWDLNEGKSLSTLVAGAEIHSLCFSPNRYWLCGAVGSNINIWDLETKQKVATLELPKADEVDQTATNQKKKRTNKKLPVVCTSLAWSHDGKTLFAGYTNNEVFVWSLVDK